MKDIIPNITMKELERITFRALQESFTEVMGDILTKIDELLCEHRDKTRFRYIDKRDLKFESMFGRIKLKRRYYKDRVKGGYVSLLEHYLEFDGSKGMSPVVQDIAMELAVTGVSYRQAGKALEKLLGYQVISHEAIRQQVLNTEVMPKEPETIDQEVLFVEVDGLYTKSQGKKKKGREIKIASVHKGGKSTENVQA